MMNINENTLTGTPYSVIRFNKVTGQLEQPTLLLKTRSGKVLGNINYSNLSLSFVAKGLDNLSFDVHKTVNGKECECWDKLIDLCIIDYVGYGQFEAHVTINDADETVKSVICESLETELGQHIIRDMHINDEDAVDFCDGNFIPTTLCDFNNPEYSLLHRVLREKTPHWTIGGCSSKININGTVYDSNSIQRTFTISNQTPYDFFDGEVSNEFGVVFTYNTYTREVFCYNLEECVYDERTRKAIDGYHCIDNIYYDENGNIISDTSNLGYCEGIGKDTSIFVSKSKLSNSLSMESDQGSIKNCFYVSGGDDLLTDTVAAANVTGNYIYLFGNFQYEDMSDELVDQIKSYSKLLKDNEANFNKIGGVYVHDPSCRYDEKTDTCFDSYDRILPTAKHIGEKVYIIDPLAYYKNDICYSRDDDPNIDAIYEKPGLYTEYCQLLDRIQYLEHTKFPSISSENSITALEEKENIVEYFKTHSVITRNECDSETFSHITGNIKSMINVICDTRFSAKILSGDSYSQSCTAINSTTTTGTWKGYVRLEREINSSDSTEFELLVNVKLTTNTDDDIEYCKQKMLVAIAHMDISELDFTKLSDDELESLLKQYNLNSLKSFCDGFNSCRAVLRDLYSNMELDESEITIPTSDSYIISTEAYNKRYSIAKGIYDERTAKVEELMSDKIKLSEEIDKFRETISMESNFEEALWKEFRSYVREDEYSNSNYISDGLSNSECLKKAMELLEVAKDELSKACMIQYSVSGDINNIFSQQQLEILHQNFDLFNYIRTEIDGKIFKLRLMEIGFSQDSPEKLNVTFSQQIESVNQKISDTQKILEQSASIATSYSYTTKQAKQGATALNTFENIKREGLDSSLYLLKNSNTEEQIFGNSGLFCKSMLDSGIYSPHQLAITHNGIYMTDNGFDSIKTAFGLFKYNDEWKYGLNTDVIIGDLIIGEKLLIQNQNENGETSVTIDKDGIDITNGSIALSGNDYSIEIDPNHNNTNTLNNYLFCVRKKNNNEINDTNEIVMSVDTEGNAYFKGELETSKGKIGNWTIGNAIYNGTNSATSNNTGTYIGTDAIRQYNSDERFVHIQGGKLTCNDAEIRGTIHANGGTFSGNITSNATISGGSIVGGAISGGSISIGDGNFAVNSSGQLTAKNANISGVIYAEGGTFSGDITSTATITGGSISGSTITGGTIRGSSFSSIGDNWDFTNIHNGQIETSTICLRNPKDSFLCHIYYIEGNSTKYALSFDKFGIDLDSDITANNFYGKFGDNFHGKVYVNSNSNFVPDSNEVMGCGGGEHKWRVVYAKSGTINTSDRNQKNNIEEISKIYEDLFFRINPVTYKFNNGDRIHIGAISQDIEHSMHVLNLTPYDFAGFCKDVKMKSITNDIGDYVEVPDLDEQGNEQYEYGIRYSEFIMLNTHMIQKAYKKIEQQQEQINQQQSEIASLKETISSFMQNN